MRPIKLKIKGLNSFIEEQIIDFDKLTDRGFFGIFGPTGSGKSTILDGITLALYGDLSRKSSNYINTNCKTLNVSFEFQISGVEVKRYVVSREFKRDNKTGNVRTSRAKIIDITNEMEDIIEDKVKAVTEKCEQIIGLKIDDFTRTVVLPQGKFSDFLKLEGKTRREMLERLFNLQKYGNNLSIKLSREINKEKTEKNLLLGELKGYEEISEDKLLLKEQELKSAKVDLENSNNKLKESELIYNESQEIWNLQLELNSYKERESQLNNRFEEIEASKIKLKFGEATLKVNPYILAYEKSIKDSDEIQKEKENLEIIFKNYKVKKDEAEKKLLEIVEKKDKEIPELKLRQQKINDVIDENKSLNILENEIKEISVKVKVLRYKYRDDNKKYEDVENEIKSMISNIKELEIKYESLKIDDNLKQKVQEGLLINEKYNIVYKNVSNSKEKLSNTKLEINNLKLKFEELEKQYKENLTLLNSSKIKLEELIKNPKGNQDDLLILQKDLNQCEDDWENFNKYCEDIKKSEKIIEELNKGLIENKNKKNNYSDKFELLKEKYKKLEIENLALKIRMDLKDGEVCPVCGSIEHKIKFDDNQNIEVSKEHNLSKLSEEINELESTLKVLEQDITISDTKIKAEQEVIKQKNNEINNLGQDFKKVLPKELKDKFNKLKNDLEDYEKTKENLENSFNELKDKNHTLDNQICNISTIIREKENAVILINEEYNTNLFELNKINKILTHIKEEIKVDDFNAKNIELLKIQKEREELESKVKNLRVNFEKLTAEKDKLQIELNLIKEEGTELRTSLDEKNKNKDEKIKLITNKLQKEFKMSYLYSDINEDMLLHLLKEVEKQIEDIEEEFKVTNEFKEQICNKYEKYNEDYIKIVTKQNEIIRRCEVEKNNLNISLKEEGFESAEQVKKNIISKAEMEYLKEMIEKYKEDLSKIRGAIETSIAKLNNREITKEKWVEIQRNLEVIKNEVKALNEIEIKLNEEYKIICNKLNELKDLLKEKEKLDHKLALLDDLDKLFKGKKFVEFVAITRLKYISMEASKRLKEITNGNYGLEVDENGKFIIRDYKNGGAERDASTLSGGETFLTSLALALALSAQIQLKGTAPLELFFLDEGFGTLDDNLLEVVMGSLERLHNDKLKVGIISHVESIKNRVPVKLILTPSECGEGGSKVRLERS